MTVRKKFLKTGERLLTYRHKWVTLCSDSLSMCDEWRLHTLLVSLTTAHFINGRIQVTKKFSINLADEALLPNMNI